MAKKNKLFAGMQKSMQKMDEKLSSGQTIIEEINIKNINPNPYQPRKYFDEETLENLANNIKEHGLDQPITVTYSDGMYTLVSGERRVRASKIAGLPKIKAIIVKYDSILRQKKALWENVLRDNLSTFEIYESISNIKKIEKINTVKELSSLINLSYAQTRSLLSFSKLSKEMIELYNSLSSPIPIQVIERLSSVQSEEISMKYMKYIISNNLSRIKAMKYISDNENMDKSNIKTIKDTKQYTTNYSKSKYEIKINREKLSEDTDKVIHQKLVEIEELLKNSK